MAPTAIATLINDSDMIAIRKAFVNLSASFLSPPINPTRALHTSFSLANGPARLLILLITLLMTSKVLFIIHKDPAIGAIVVITGINLLAKSLKLVKKSSSKSLVPPNAVPKPSLSLAPPSENTSTIPLMPLSFIY